MIHFNAVPWANAAVVGALLCLGCSSSNLTKASQGGGDAGADNGPGTAGASDIAVGGQPPATEGGAGANAGGDGSVQGAGGAPGTLGATAHGHVDLVQSQIASAFHYTLQGGFVRYADVVAPANGIVCTTSTIGNCLVSACTISDVANPGTPPVGTVLDAGLLTVTGAGASKAVLEFGTGSPKSKQPGYPAVSADKQFFGGGDSIVLVGAGGVDLPAFKAQKLIAPSEIVLTAPACSGASCPDVDRSKDLTVAWTAGGAGNLKASFETVGDTATAYVFCTFEAAAGTGTVPKAALAQLGDTRDGTTTGIELFASENEATFDVANVPTTFSLQTSGIQALMTISK